MKKVIIAPDSFKGSLSSQRVCSIIKEELEKKYKDTECLCIPVADGGEGTVDAYLYALGGERVYFVGENPVGEATKAYYALIDENTAIMEMAAISGITLLGALSPMDADTYGTGQMIISALDRGVRHIIMGIGGSATTDGGTGCIRALGGRFLDSAGNCVPRGGKGLSEISTIDLRGLDRRLLQCRFTVLCDVTNPLYGEKGAAYVFAPQKGADDEQVRLLDNGLRIYAGRASAATGKDFSHCQGAGAAGGLGFALMTFLNGEIKGGIDNILDMCSFGEKLKDADLVITGEGKMDSQSLNGKVPFSVAERAGDIRTVAVVGVNEIDPDFARKKGIDEIICTNPEGLPFSQVLPKCEEMLREAAGKIRL